MRLLFLSTLVVLACQGDSSSLEALNSGADADAAVDGAIDSGIDAADPTVRVHVPGFGPFTVLFYDPSNQLVATRTTDSAGRASAPLPQGGTVVAAPVPQASELQAMFGVEPGDNIEFPGEVLVQGTRMNITVPPRAATTAIDVGSRCGSSTQTSRIVTVFTNVKCRGETFPVLAQAQFQGQVAAAQRGNVTMPFGPMPTGELTGEWLAAAAQTVTITNGALPIRGLFAQYPVLEGHVLAVTGGSQLLSIDANATQTISYTAAPSSTVDGRQLEILFRLDDRFQRVHHVIPPSPAAVDVDFAAEQLPWYDLSIRDGYDIASRTVPLTRSAGAALDVQLVKIGVRTDFTEVGKVWNCIVPPDWTEFTLPVLPAEFQKWDPSGPAVLSRGIAAKGVSASSYQGYDDFRRGVPVTKEHGSFYNTSVYLYECGSCQGH